MKTTESNKLSPKNLMASGLAVVVPAAAFLAVNLAAKKSNLSTNVGFNGALMIGGVLVMAVSKNPLVKATAGAVGVYGTIRALNNVTTGAAKQGVAGLLPESVTSLIADATSLGEIGDSEETQRLLQAMGNPDYYTKYEELPIDGMGNTTVDFTSLLT